MVEELAMPRRTVETRAEQCMLINGTSKGCCGHFPALLLHFIHRRERCGPR